MKLNPCNHKTPLKYSFDKKTLTVNGSFLIINSTKKIILTRVRNSRKYYYYRRPIGDPLETYRRPIGDRNALSETHRRPTCLIGD